MKVVFACNANVIRSQMGAAFYNKMSGAQDASSAGIRVDAKYPELDTLKKMADSDGMVPAPRRVIRAMSEIGIDVSGAPRMQMTPAMISEYDLVVNFNDSTQNPDRLVGDNVIWWNVADPHGNGIFEQIVTARDQIEPRVKKLVEIERVGGDIHELDENIDKEHI